MTPTSTAAKSGFTTEAFDHFLTTRDGSRTGCAISDGKPGRPSVSEICPSRREEEWMRTDIRLFHLEDFGLPATGQQRHAGPAAS